MDFKLDSIDKRILYELDLNARISESMLARKINKNKQLVRYRIQKLESLGIITGYSIWTDPIKLNYLSIKIYLKLANKPNVKKEFIKYVTSDPRLYWLGIAEGSWNAGLSYLVKSNEEFFNLKNKLFSKFKNFILSNEIGIIVNVCVKNKLFLCLEQSSWITMFDTIYKYDLNFIEKNIVKSLFLDSRSNIVTIANELDSTVDVVRNRMKKLREIGVIMGYTTKIDFNKLGYEMYKTFIYFKNLTKDDEVRLFSYCKNDVNIIHILKMIGPWDIELDVMCENYSQYNQVISNLTEKFSDIIYKTETAILSEDHVCPSFDFI